jgi:hypothetical protein
MPHEIPKAVFRVGGSASVAAGVLMISGFALHPAGEDPTFGTDPLWVPAHGLLWLAFTLALVGWMALYVHQASQAGPFGVAAFTVLILGTSLAAWIFSSDVTFVPVIAEHSPQLFHEIFDTPHLVIGIASVLSWVLGSVLFGISVVRAKVFPRLAGVLLGVGTLMIPITYLAGLSVRVTSIGAMLAGAAQIWLGFALLSSLARQKGRTLT